MSEPSRFGPYTLVYPLGAGGMGQVYLARHAGEHGIERLIALKRMLVHLTGREKLVRLFLDEVRIAAQLNHGNIVQVIDHGVIEGQYFMAMEYVHGENLSEVLGRIAERREYLPLDLVFLIGSCLCEALDYAHRKRGIEGRPLGIVHRDVSPHNVLLSFQGEVKLADFGVARAAEQTHQTLGGELRGKIAYMSPEQAHGRPLDGRSDLFSLGVLLYEALTNRSPFQRENALATLDAVRAVQLPALSMIRPELPAEVCELVHRTLDPEMDRRPDSARSLYEALQQASRLHNLVASPFDLADYLRDLFPEAKPLGGDGGGAEVRTEVGRRADQVAELERRAVSYLRTRHSARTGELALPEAAVGSSPTGRLPGRWPRARFAIAGLALVTLGGGLALLVPRLGGGIDVAGASDLRALSPVRGDGAVAPPSPDAAATSLPPAREGRLVLRSTPPGASLLLDGARRGSTPVTLALGAGRHLYTLSLKGHRPLKGAAEVTVGKSATIEARLEPLPSLLAVRSSHRCQVSLEGKPIGETPIQDRVVPPGSLRVACRDPRLGIDEQRRVRVLPGETAQVVLSFGVLALNLEPWAEVSVDGVRRGTTPLRLLLTEGEHRVLLKSPERGGLERRLSVVVRANKPSLISSW
jgi:serine/threonine-protein kinase